MSVTLINGDGNPRVLASQDADWYGALTGQKTCIVPINDNLSATITDSNTVEIGSGVCITKEGRRVQIDEGDIEEIIIPTGTQGVDTYYIIGFHLYINESGQQVAETFVETMASATDTITETTFKEGSSSIYVSLYRVKRSGLLMESVTQIIPTLKTIVDINDTLGSTDISEIGDGTVTGNISEINNSLTEINSDLSVIGNKYQTTSLLTTSIPATTETAILRLTNLPKGVYVVSGDAGGSVAMGTGGSIVLRTSNRTDDAMTAIYNTGYTINGAIASVVEFSNDGNTITLLLNVGVAKTITYGRLTAVRIA